MKFISILTIVLAFGLLSCHQKNNSKAIVGVNPKNFEKTIDGKEVKLFTLENKKGIKVQITNYGGRIVSIITPDKNGKMADIALGYSNIDKYLTDDIYMSGIIGRFGNRIGKGKFSINNKDYTLATNDGANALHGGVNGYNHVIWDAKQNNNSLELRYVSPDMEEGYPGELTIKVEYILSEDNTLSMIYTATTNKPTIVNLTNHTYYNLKGDGDNTILDHHLKMVASHYTPVDSTLIPTGDITDVSGTPFDFREGKLIGQDIEQEDQQLTYGFGFDHNWVLDTEPGKLEFALELSEETTGRVMKMYTTEPGMQFYCGNFMNGTVSGKSGKKYEYRSAVALEPQHFPDSPNQANFPSTILNPGEKYYHKSVLEFYTK